MRKTLIISMICGVLLTLGFAWIPAAVTEDEHGPGDWLAQYEHNGPLAAPGSNVNEAFVRRTWASVCYEATGIKGAEDLYGFEAFAKVDCRPWARTRGELFDTGGPINFDHSSTRVRELRGWPLLAMWCDWDGMSEATDWDWPVRGGFKLPNLIGYKAVSGMAYGRAIPFLVIWTGFITDTLFWAMVIASIRWLARTSMHSWRNRRGRCANCGYDARGLARCPECGKVVSRAVARGLFLYSAIMYSTLLAAVALASPLSPTESPIQARIDAIVSASGGAVSASTLGNSRQGRPLHVLTLGEGDADAMKSRPALLIAAGLDARHKAGIDTALGLAEKLAKDKPDWLKTTTVYIVPCLNPDGVVASDTKPLVDTGRTIAPYDADHDGRIGEEPPEDLNGDGMITMMRVKNPAPGSGLVPTLIEDADEPRLMKEPDANKGEKPVYALLLEGRDKDGDGKFAEDGRGADAFHGGGGGIDLEMNWPANWPQFRDGASNYPLSEPESLHLADWVLAHENIVCVLEFGRNDWLVNIPESGRMDVSGRVPVGIEEGDKPLYEAVSTEFKKITGMTAAPKGDMAGSLMSWTYAHFGVPSFSTPVWVRPDQVKKEEKKEDAKDGEKKDGEKKEPAAADDDKKADAPPATPPPTDTPRPARGAGGGGRRGGGGGAGPGGGGPRGPGGFRGGGGGGNAAPAAEGHSADDVAWLKYSDNSCNGAGFVPWKEFDHPQLGKVEIGGFVPGFKLSYPQADLPRLVDEQAAFTNYLVSKFARVESPQFAVHKLAAGLWRIDERISNSGVWPTAIKIGTKARRAIPVVTKIGVPIESIVSGERLDRDQAIDGGRSVEHSWTVKAADGSQVVIETKLPWGQTIKTGIKMEVTK